MHSPGRLYVSMSETIRGALIVLGIARPLCAQVVKVERLGQAGVFCTLS